MRNVFVFSKNLVVYYCKCCNLICYATRYLFVISKFSEVTIEFLVLWLIEMSRLSRDNHLARGDYRMSLEIVLQKEVSEGNWKFFVSYSVPVSYRNHPFDG